MGIMNRPILWKLVERPPYKTGLELTDALEKKGYKPCDWNKDIFSRMDLAGSSVKWPLPLVRVSLDSLGFKGPATLKEFYERAFGEGFENPTPEAAALARFIYDEQPTGEWLRFAVPLGSMIDSDGVPHLPKLGHALGNYYLHTYWAYPQAVFHPHNEFVFVDRKQMP
jgi:hypothetical protein